MRPVDTARSRIVLLGTPSYDTDELADVPVVANNIADLLAVLTDPRLGGFPASSCVVVPARASTAEVGDLLIQAAEDAEDLLLFYYAGHGLLSPHRKELYLSLAGTRPGSRVEFTALAFESVRSAWLGSRAENRAVILDSCFSGRAIGETLSSGEEEILGQIQVSGTYTLTSAPANRVALILEGEEHTAFTERLLALLTNGIATAGDMLSFRDIYQHLNAQFRAEGLPTPQQRGTETADRLGLVRNRAVAKTEPSRPRPAKPRTPRPYDRRSTGSSILDSLFDGFGEGVGLAAAGREGDRKWPSSQPPTTLGGTAWVADFVVEPGGTVHFTRDLNADARDGAGGQAEKDVPRLTALERGYWSVRNTSGWVATGAAVLLGIVNLGLAVAVPFGPASAKWLFLLIPGVPMALGGGLAGILGGRGVVFNLILALGYIGCAVGSVTAVVDANFGALWAPILAPCELALILFSAHKARALLT